MDDFKLTKEDFMKMFQINTERALKVCDIIFTIESVRRSITLKDKKKHYAELETKILKYYHTYNIADLEKVKDKLFLNKLKQNIANHEIREIERLL